MSKMNLHIQRLSNEPISCSNYKQLVLTLMCLLCLEVAKTTVQELVQVHQFMLEELKKLVADFFALDDHSKYNTRSFGTKWRSSVHEHPYMVCSVSVARLLGVRGLRVGLEPVSLLVSMLLNMHRFDVCVRTISLSATILNYNRPGTSLHGASNRSSPSRTPSLGGLLSALKRLSAEC